MSAGMSLSSANFTLYIALKFYPFIDEIALDIPKFFCFHGLVDGELNFKFFLQFGDKNKVIHGVPVRNRAWRHFIINFLGGNFENFLDDGYQLIHIVFIQSGFRFAFFKSKRPPSKYFSKNSLAGWFFFVSLNKILSSLALFSLALWAIKCKNASSIPRPKARQLASKDSISHSSVSLLIEAKAITP